MANEIAEKCAHLSIVPGDNDILDLNDSIPDGEDDKLSLRLVRKLLTHKSFNSEALKRTFQQV